VGSTAEQRAIDEDGPVATRERLITVIVAPTDFVSPDEAARTAAILLLVEDILTVPGHVAAHRSIA